MRRILVLSAAALLAGCAGTPEAPPGPGQRWRLDQLSAGGEATRVQAVLAGDYAAVAWVERSGSDRKLYLAERGEAGWGAPELLAGDGGDPVYGFELAGNPDGDAAIAWREDQRVRVRVRKDGAWQPVQDLAHADPMRIALAVDEDGTPWVAWREKIGSDYRIRIARDEGQGFTSETATPAGVNAQAPGLAVRTGEAVLAWLQNGEVRGREFQAGAWQAQVALDTTAMGSNGEPGAVLGTNDAVVYWTWSFMSDSIKFAERVGGTWSRHHSLGATGAEGPTACVDEDRFLFAWNEPATGGQAVVAQIRENGRWSRAAFLSLPGAKAKEPAAACAGGRVLVAWAEVDQGGKTRVLFAEHGEAGWRLPSGPDEAISKADAGAFGAAPPAVRLLEDGRALVAWVQEDAAGTPSVWVAERK